MKRLQLLLPVLLLQCMAVSAQLVPVTDFGTNPGNLNMFLFEPSTPKAGAEVVLVLHGCGQNATNFATQTGWNVLAERYGFYVVYAEQKAINNPTRCFNWFLNSDNEREAGEAKSLVEMIQYVHDNYTTDMTKSFVCGLSAGGAMTPVMMACYPDVIKSGGVWAGVPYLYAPLGNNDITPMEWGDKARSAYPDYTGPYPTLFICQGTNDGITEPINEERLVAQWTNVHGTDQVPEQVDTNFLDNPNIEENVYLNSSNDTIIKSYTISGMEHGIAVDPGSGPFQGGETAAGAYDVDFYSTYWMADFFGIIEEEVPNSTVQLNASDIKVLPLRNGALKVINNTRVEHLQVVVFDMLGRVMVQSELGQETLIPANQLNRSRIVAVSIINRNDQRVYSKLVARNRRW